MNTYDGKVHPSFEWRFLPYQKVFDKIESSWTCLRWRVEKGVFKFEGEILDDGLSIWRIPWPISWEKNGSRTSSFVP